ncbi:hypothetical protein LCGC14_2580300 [marine sediment metagenome]|uniref:Uncharacterized protein n=1 Tax=marine sediment metagenome TaxID=412755 RepID=A0A0F9B2I0_9ZZZZ
MNSAITLRVILIVLGVSLMGMGCRSATESDEGANVLSGELPSMAEALSRIYALGGRTWPERPKSGDIVTSVSLADTAATNADLGALRVLEGLRTLDLSGTQVTGEGLAVLGAIETLEWISLEGLDIPESYLADLRDLPLLKHRTPLTAHELSLGRAHHVRPFDQRLLEAWLVSDSDLTISDWATSDDGALSLRLMILKGATAANARLTLLGELRNNTDEPIDALRPFGDPPLSWSRLYISGPDGSHDPAGPSMDYGLAATAFATVPPGRTVRGHLDLSGGRYTYTGGRYTVVDNPGRYTIAYGYEAHAGHRRSAVFPRFGKPNVWVGEIRSEPITLERR